MEAETEAEAQGFLRGAGPKPGNRQVSSLDRFVNGRGPVFAGVTDDSRRIRISVVYRASNDPDWNTGGWLPAYSDAIDVKRVRK